LKQLFNNKKLITLLIVFILFIGVLWFSFSNFGSPPYFQQITSDFTAVVGRTFSAPVNGINNFFSDVKNLQNTFEENKRLKEELDGVAQAQADLATYRQENEKLREELELQDTLTDFTSITGSVIARNPDMWIDQIIINRGSSDGVEAGMSVMSSGGLIGRVSEVNPTSSKVTLLTTNDETAVLTSAEIILEDETIFGVVNGYDAERGYLIMEQITSTSTIEEGAEIVSSGLGGLVPRGLVIGTVADVSLDRYGLGQRVYIEPETDFEDIRYVTIINRSSETIDIMNEDQEEGE
jgi:rod shape-determining protein MreC